MAYRVEDLKFKPITFQKFFNFLAHLPLDTPLEQPTEIKKIKNKKDKSNSRSNAPSFNNRVFSAYLMKEDLEATTKNKILFNYHNIHGTPDHLRTLWYAAAQTQVQQGAICTPSMHVVINETNLHGRHLTDIIGTRVLCVDIDRGIESSEAKSLVARYKPELVIQSSPGKYHFYWRVQGMDLDTWQMMQLSLAHKLGGDYTLAQKNKTIRVPAFYRVKSGENDEIKIFSPSIVYQDLVERSYTVSQLQHKWPWLNDAYQEAVAKQKEAFALQRKMVSRLRGLSDTPGTSFDPKQISSMVGTLGGRNEAMFSTLAMFGNKLSQDGLDSESPEFTEKLCDYADRLNNSFGKPLELTEVAGILKKVIRRTGAKAYERKIWEASQKKELLKVAGVGATDATGAELEGDRKAPKLKIVKRGVVPPPVDEGEGESPLPEVGTIGKSLGTRSPSHLPKSLKESANKFADKMLENDPVGLAHLLNHDIAHKNPSALCRRIIDAFHSYGSFTQAGPAVVLRGQSKWGSTVVKPTTMLKEQWSAFIDIAINNVAVQLVHNGGSFASSEGGTACDIVKKMPAISFIEKVAHLSWNQASLELSQQRQRSDVIVYQNGVLYLDEGSFDYDETACIRYSHPIHANFNADAAALLKKHNYGNNQALLAGIGSIFSKYLQDWFPDDSCVVDLLLTWYGYCMTTDIDQQKFIFMYGPTGAGKGSISQILCGILGDNNYVGATYAVLDGGFKSAALYNKLLTVIEECGGTQIQHRQRLEFLKKVTGGEKMQIELKYLNAFDDYLCSKFMLQSNSVPTYNDDGEAISQRMIPLGFEQSYRKGGSPVLPSKQVLEETIGGDSDGSGVALPDVIATLAGIMWMKRRVKKDAFTAVAEGAVGGVSGSGVADKSRALAIGQKMLDRGMNMIRATLMEYFEVVPEGDVLSDNELISTAFLREFIHWSSDEVELPRGSKDMATLLKTRMSETYPECSIVRQYVSTHDQKSKIVRGRPRVWDRLKFRKEKLEDTLYLLEECASEWIGTNQHMLEYFSQYSEELADKKKSVLRMF